MYLVYGSRSDTTSVVVLEAYCTVCSVLECVTLMMYPVTAPFSSPGAGVAQVTVIEYGEFENPDTPVGEPLGPMNKKRKLVQTSYYFC